MSHLSARGSDVGTNICACPVLCAGTAMLVIVVLPMKALRGAVSRAQMAHSGAFLRPPW